MKHPTISKLGQSLGEIPVEVINRSIAARAVVHAGVLVESVAWVVRAFQRTARSIRPTFRGLASTDRLETVAY